MPVTTLGKLEIRRNEDGSVDEIMSGDVHLEQMDGNHWWLGIGEANIHFLSRSKITVSAEEGSPQSQSVHVLYYSSSAQQAVECTCGYSETESGPCLATKHTLKENFCNCNGRPPHFHRPEAKQAHEDDSPVEFSPPSCELGHAWRPAVVNSGAVCGRCGAEKADEDHCPHCNGWLGTNGKCREQCAKSQEDSDGK